MDRRIFLGMLAAAAAAGTLSPSLALSKPRKKGKRKEVFAAPGRDELLQQNLAGLSAFGDFHCAYLAGSPSPGKVNLVLLRTGTEKVEAVVTMNLGGGHAIVLPDRVPARYAVVPDFDGPRASVVDLKEGKLAHEMELKGAIFPGHGCFSADGSLVYLPEFDSDADRPGRVVARSLPDLKVVRVYETGAYKPHNVLLDRTGKKLYVGHYGRSLREGDPPTDGGFALIDLGSGKRLPVPAIDHVYLALCHVELGAGDDFYISTRSWAGGNQIMSPVLFAGAQSERFEVRLPEEIKDRFRFNFSLKFHAPSGTLAVNHIDGKMVTFWNGPKREYLGMIDLGKEEPLGLELTPDGKHFIVNSKSGKVYFIAPEERKIVKETSLLSIGWSPHINVIPQLA